MLAKKPDDIAEITSISANLTHDFLGIFYSSLLLLELNHSEGLQDYFALGVRSSSSGGCHPLNLCPAVAAPAIIISLEYLGNITKCKDDDPEYPEYYYLRDENLAPYTSTTLSKPGIYNPNNKEFTIELDKTNKKIIVKNGEQSGYFDISNAYFGDLTNATAKFFINANISANHYGFVDSNAFYQVALIDDVKINGQTFDDFSENTLNPQRWEQANNPYVTPPDTCHYYEN